MDPRTASHVLAQISAYLELHGESRYKSRAYEQAARAVGALDTDDLAPLDRDGTLAATRGVGPATLSVLRDLIATGESRYLQQLRADLPAGVLDLLRVPGLSIAKIHLLHETLGIDSVDALEAAARDGRLAKVNGFGPKTVQRLLEGIALHRRTGRRQLHHRAAAEARTLLAAVRAHPDVTHAEIAGSVRRHHETVGDVDVVAACRRDPAAVAASFARAPGVREVRHASPTTLAITYTDGGRLDLHCVTDEEFAVALWRATGSDEHLRQVGAHLAQRGFTLDGDVIHDAKGRRVPVPDEPALYALAGLSFVPPEMREGIGEVAAAREGTLPPLLTPRDIAGVLHCHSTWSDGKASIAELAAAAEVRGWSYIGITDHSQSAFYAGGLSPDEVVAQHAEIDALNAADRGVRILKGVEADILPDGSLDYDERLLDRFDYVVGSVHSQFKMDRGAMTDRVLRALDDPHLTILGHPTGRLLLSRQPYAIDMVAVIEKAGAAGVALELNADPRRLDLDWRFIPRARAAGVVLEIGPDAHSVGGLDNMTIGVAMARKAGVTRADVLNARSAAEVVAFAAARRNV